MVAGDLKKWIIDNNKIQTIIEDLGCHHFKEYSKEYRCGLPNRKNSTAVAIKKDNLKIKIFKPDSEIVRGDIFTLVMDIKKISFPKAVKYIHEILGLKYEYKKNKKEDIKRNPLEIFEKVKRPTYVINKDELEIYDDSILKEYIPLPHISWVREGIMPFTCKEFNIGYSADKKRIVIPERYWCGSEDDYLGIMGRTTIEAYKLLDIPKYYPLKKYYKGMNLYGLQENYKYIQEAGIVTVFEAQKSVLKRHSRLDRTGVAIGSHDITDEQVNILIGLDVDIVIAMDKGVDINHIRGMCNKFYGLRNVYYIYDKYNLLRDKDSPADAPNKIFNYLFKYKIKYDENERGEYLKWVESQEKNYKKSATN